MENRTNYDDGLTIPELCKRVLDYEFLRDYSWFSYFKLLVKDYRWLRPMVDEASVTKEINEKQLNTIKSLTKEKLLEFYYFKKDEEYHKVDQMRKMIIRTRRKYQAGSKYNDTNIMKHQYYLLPPKLEQENRQWRCVHVVEEVNEYLLELRDMFLDKYVSGLRMNLRRDRQRFKNFDSMGDMATVKERLIKKLSSSNP
jgi:hypothetical protein